LAVTAIAACPVDRAFNHYLLLLLNCSNEVWGNPRRGERFGLAYMALTRRGLHAKDIADKLLW
jgi:hypothetical protein